MDAKLSSNKIEVVLRNEESSEDSISLKEIIEAIISGKKKILSTILVFLIISIGFISFQDVSSTRTVKTIVMYNYEGINQGFDPAGNKLDTSSIKAPFIISDVVKNLKLSKYGINTESLRNSISIKPIIPGDVTQKIKDMQESKSSDSTDKSTDYKYYPINFEVNFAIPNNSVSNTKGEEILNEIIRLYNGYFSEKYSSKQLLADVVEDINYDEYDYPETMEIINKQVRMINDFLSPKLDISDFRSHVTGMSFQDIKNSVSVIERVDVEVVDSLISTYNLTKDKEKLMKFYEYRIERLKLDKDKKYDESVIAGNMMDKYKRQDNILTAASGLLTNGKKEDQKNEGSNYSDLADQTLTAGVDAKNSVHDIEYYQYLLKKLQSDGIVVDKKGIEKNALDKMKKVSSSLEKWVKISNDTNNEYLDLNYNSVIVKRKTPSETYFDNISKLIVIGVALAAGLLVGLIISLVTAYWKSIRKNELLVCEHGVE